MRGLCPRSCSLPASASPSRSRYTLRKGPLVIFGTDNGVSRAFRNLPGVEVASVDRLNLLQVRRGGRAGREGQS